MSDTREAGRMLQSLRGAKVWHFGPFFAGRTELTHATNWMCGMFLTPWHSIAIQLARHP